MKFSEMGIGSEVSQSLERMGLVSPTEIQERTIPLLKEGRDVIGQSETGSGKTLAFAVPIVERLVPREGVQALILTPTRELAKQIKTEFEKLVGRKFRITTVYGGVGFEPQIEGLAHSEIVVATPGRMLDHLRRGNCSLGKVRQLVLDEADRMLEMGFIEDVEAIIKHVPKERQTMLFSATIPPEIVKISRKYLQDPTQISTKQFVDTSLLHHVYVDCMDNEKFSLLVHLVRTEGPSRAMVFCGRRSTVDLVSDNLFKQGIRAKALHGGLTQARREQVLEEFHSGRIQILVATDVAARGLDIKEVTHIYNYNVPDNPDDYTHRVGRTARAGESGKAISIISPMDYENFRRITPFISIKKEEVGSFQQVPFFARRRESFEGGRGGFRRGGFRGQGRPQDRYREHFKRFPRY